MSPTVLVTGGAGFVGSNFVLQMVRGDHARVVNVDKLTYAGNLENLADLEGDSRHVFVHGDICDRALVAGLLDKYRPAAIVNFAAESHVDRSIDAPATFVNTNVLGTLELLEAARRYVAALPTHESSGFRFLQVSTDEVYGSAPPGALFDENSRQEPNSPYAATKAGADMLVRAYHRTYGLPTITTNCSNNYGPYQFPEKLVPLCILNALDGRPLPLYGDGGHVRDWIFVEDHCEAIRLALASGMPGETYAIAARAERTNLEVVETLCGLLDELAPRSSARSHRDLVTFVADRPGHDRRYALDASKAARALGWSPKRDFSGGMRATVSFYLAHLDWCARIGSAGYRRERLGLGGGSGAAG
jgi:dTDP-glucose 4,6-dehydratase